MRAKFNGGSTGSGLETLARLLAFGMMVVLERIAVAVAAVRRRGLAGAAGTLTSCGVYQGGQNGTCG